MKTLKYTLIQVLFCVLICALSGYATVFLLDKQFSNMIIGSVLSISNVLGILLQQVIATIVDNSKGKIKAKHIVLFAFTMIAVISLLLSVLKNANIIFLVLFILIFMFMGVVNPFITAMIFEIDKEGKEINFGLARGMGSAGYAVASLILGNLTAVNGTAWLPKLYIILAIMTSIVVLTFKTPNSHESEITVNKKEEKQNSENFFKKYPLLTQVLLSVVFIFFGFNLINGYLVHIVRNVGGNQSQLGIAMFLAAVVELPSMAMSNKLQAKFGHSKLMMIAALFFGIKHTLLWLAPNMTVVYISQILQFCSYAFFIPVSVYLVSDLVENADQMKGQALMTGAVSVGGVLASAIGGALLDLVGVSQTLLCATIVTWIGAVLLISVMKKTQK